MIIKYSIGPITSIRDKDSVEKKEDSIPMMVDQACIALICRGCGIQHIVSNNESRICCGNLLSKKNLS